MTLHRSKPCKQCGTVKKLRAFYKAPHLKDGYMNTCRECHRANVYANRELKREHYEAKRREYLADPQNYQAHLERMRQWRRTEHGKAVMDECRKAWAVMHPEQNAAIVRAHQKRTNERRKLLRAQARAAA